MKNITIIVFCLLFANVIPSVFGQSDDVVKELQMDLIVTDEQKIILFIGFIIAILGILLYLARDIILRTKTAYDHGEFDSKKDKTYDKYHSDYSDDYEEIGSRNNSKEEKEFRFELQNSSIPNYYKILQVSQDATFDEIKKQYRNLVKTSHPDKNKEEKSQEIMILINKAYEVLSNPVLRKKYDGYLNRS